MKTKTPTTPSNRCRRCRRPLSNIASVNHGFGRICWSKIQNTAYEDLPASMRITITDRTEAQKSIEKIRESMDHIEKKECRCGEPLNPVNIEYYDHEGGYNLPGFGKPQWLMHHCKKCNYDYSLWKLGVPEIGEVKEVSHCYAEATEKMYQDEP